jgi:hypothetical protein
MRESMSRDPSHASPPSGATCVATLALDAHPEERKEATVPAIIATPPTTPTLIPDLEGPPADGDRVSEALRLVEANELGDAATLLGPLFRAKRHIRASHLNAEPTEVDEVKGWLRAAIADPGSEDSRFMVERAYYKLRTLRDPGATLDPRRPARRPSDSESTLAP